MVGEVLAVNARAIRKRRADLARRLNAGHMMLDVITDYPWPVGTTIEVMADDEWEVSYRIIEPGKEPRTAIVRKALYRGNKW